MATIKEIEEGILDNIKDTLTNDEDDHNAKLRATQSLKKFFKSPDEIFSRLRLDSLLRGARTSLRSKKSEKDFLYQYGASLIGFFGRNVNVDAELLYQLEYILGELKKEDERLTDALVTEFWSRLEAGSFPHPDEILDASKPTLERTMLDWMDSPSSLQLEFLSKMSANSPKIFQILTLILYEILARTRGHEKVFELTQSFITSVKHLCKKNGKNFLGLYPKGCGRLVGLLIVPPEIYFKESKEVFDEVLSLLLETFLADRKNALILLSHYPKWISVFKVYFEENEV